MLNNISRAKDAIKTLQLTWWNGQDGWKELNSWKRCVVADAMITYTILSGDDSYINIIDAAVRKNNDLSGNDDDLWSAIAALKMFYLTGDPSFWDNFVLIEYYKICNQEWDIEGGVWWNDKRGIEGYKNSITNELWLSFVMLMYIANGHQDYLDWGNTTWNWLKNSGLICPDNLVSDGLPEQKHNQKWTYNQGVILSGLANLYQFSSPIESLKEQGFAISNAVTRLLTLDGILDEKDVENGIIKENGDDADIFKGIYMKNLGYFLSVFQDNPSYSRLNQFMEYNANHVQNNSDKNNNKINAYWVGSKQLFNAASQGSGIQLYIGTDAAGRKNQPLWSYVRVVPNIGTSATPASTSFNNCLYSIWKGADTDSGIYFSSMNAGNRWSKQLKIPNIGSSTSPALTVLNNYLYIVWKGAASDFSIYFTKMDKFEKCSSQTKIPNIGSSSAPSVTALNGDLYAAWKGVNSDTAIYFSKMNTSEIWTPQAKIPNANTTNGVSISAFGDYLYAIWKGVGSDQGIYFSKMNKVGDWSNPTKISGVGTSTVPFIVAFKGKLYAAWKGADTDKQIWYSTLDSDSSSWSPQTRFIIPGVTNRNPSLAVFNDRLYNVYAGSQKNQDSVSYAYYPCFTPRGF